MDQLIELYDIVSLNDGALRGPEKLAILKARLALRMFERAMQTFKAASAQEPAATEPVDYSISPSGHGRSQRASEPSK